MPETLVIILEWFDIIIIKSVMFWFLIDHSVLNSRGTLLKSYKYRFCSKLQISMLIP